MADRAPHATALNQLRNFSRQKDELTLPALWMFSFCSNHFCKGTPTMRSTMTPLSDGPAQGGSAPPQDNFRLESDASSEREIAIEAEARQMLPVYRLHPETGMPAETQMRWGLIQHYADKRPHVQPTHARSETIFEQRLFCDAYHKRRCIVPMSEFYLKDARSKRHAIRRNDRQLFGVAGIWENWREPGTNQWLRTFAIVTVEANEVVRPIHDRMPLILAQNDFPRWMGGEHDPRDLLNKPLASSLLSISPGLGKSRRATG
ncbi:SOS response-associated peptidase [Bradyrhizobium prioriisuperbiae]|uniref:SOS response-associated peptidase n=1 Tax=Bradyrhizobium prioriisuperbiae TaxID=2854389 RepID=UPI0028E80C6A|nr:SOS response-associated peptidase [Bradyrhizobium prioritasuperba]